MALVVGLYIGNTFSYTSFISIGIYWKRIIFSWCFSTIMSYTDWILSFLCISQKKVLPAQLYPLLFWYPCFICLLCLLSVTQPLLLLSTLGGVLFPHWWSGINIVVNITNLDQMPSIKMKTKSSTSSVKERYGLRVCLKSCVICKHSSSHVKIAQQTAEFDACMENCHDGKLLCLKMVDVMSLRLF